MRGAMVASLGPGCWAAFPICATNHAILPVLWRDPGKAARARGFWVATLNTIWICSSGKPPAQFDRCGGLAAPIECSADRSSL